MSKTITEIATERAEKALQDKMTASRKDTFEEIFNSKDVDVSEYFKEIHKL